MHIQVSSTVKALIRGGLNLAERRFTSNSSMFFPFFNISPTGPRTCSILPSNMIHLLFHVVALLCPQCNNASQKSSHRKKRLSTAEWYPLNNPHKPKTCGKDQAPVFKSWGGDYEKVLIGHFWLTLSDGALFFPSGIPLSGLSFQMHATPHKLTPDERREAFKKHLTRVWIF